MKLSDLLTNYKGIDAEIKGIKTNSKDVKDGDLFVCIKGANFDRHDFIEDAINNGASAIITSKDVNITVPYVKVDDPDKALYEISSKFYDFPQNKLKLIGITGTDGKTTSAKIVQHLLGDDICGYIGTIGVDCKYFKEKTNNTTPNIDEIIKYLSLFVKNGIKYVVIECSSESYFYHRIDDLHFDVAGLTNITKDHLNTHKTLENYIDCKKQLFIKSTTQVLNIDDSHFNEIKAVSKDISTYGSKNSDLELKSYKLYPNKTEIDINYNFKDYHINSSLVTKFNIENLMLALLICIKLGKDIEDLLLKTNDIVIYGRMESVNVGQNFYCLIDYAHTINSIKNVLDFSNTLDVNRIIVVTGQAGGRDKTKRAEIGKFILDNSDFAIFTEDDPRNEKVIDIINEMLKETNKDNYEIIIDRPSAIHKAISIAEENDLILFLGKGTDTYMARGDIREYYNEKEELLKALKKIVEA